MNCLMEKDLTKNKRKCHERKENTRQLISKNTRKTNSSTSDTLLGEQKETYKHRCYV